MFGLAIFCILGTLLLFLVFRELVCWYWKINKSVANQEKIIELLTEINGKLGSNKNELLSKSDEASINNIGSSF